MVRKFTLLALGALLSGGIMAAAIPVGGNLKKSDFLEKNKEMRKEAFKEKIRNHVSTGNKLTRANVPTDIISDEDVAGDVKYYSKACTGKALYEENVGQFVIGDYSFADAASKVVFGENNKVYFSDIMTTYAQGWWVEGILGNNEITMSLPQAVYVEEDRYGTNILYLSLLQGSGDNYTETNISSVTFSYNPITGDISLELPGDSYQYMLGYMAQYSDGEIEWSGDGDFVQDYTINTKVNTVPDNLQFSSYAMTGDGLAYPVEVAEDNNNIYIKGFTMVVPDGIVIAQKNGNGSTATIAGGEVIGCVDYIWALTGCMGESNNQLVIYPEEPYQLVIDRNTNTISNGNNTYEYLGIVYHLTYQLDGYDIDQWSYFDGFSEFEIYPRESWAGTPSNPSELYYDAADIGGIDGYYLFGFEIPTESTEGETLDYTLLYYRIFVDGELYTFTPDYQFDIYASLPYPVDEIPFGYIDGEVDQNGNLVGGDFATFQTLTYRVIRLYTEPATTLGVQSVYYYDDIETESDIITLDVSAGVESIENASVEKVVYYDLNGRKVLDPSNGIYVKKSTLSNGKVVSSKVIVK